MAEFDYDLIVLGAGSGGVRASRLAAGYGKKVAVVESAALGGTCVNVGCVPKKLFYYASHFSEEFQHSRGFGWQLVAQQFDWPTLLRHKNKEIERLNGIYEKLLLNAGVTIIEGRGQFVGPHEVSVNKQVYSAERIIIATGAQSYIPPIKGWQSIETSNEAFFMQQFPRRVVVIGGGYIAVEFAGIFSGMGAETHLVHRRQRFLKEFDEDIQIELTAELHKKNMQMHLGVEVVEVEKLPDGTFKLKLTDNSTIEADYILCATGRVPNSKDLALAKAGVETQDNGSIVVDKNFQTNVQSVYAIGDVIDRVQLTPVAIAEAVALIEHIYEHKPVQLNYRNIATAVFSQPNVGTAGLTEHKARKLYNKLRVYKSKFRHLKHTLSGSDEKTFMKLIVDDETDKVIGVHMVGADAGEIIQGMAVALQAGATKQQFDGTIGIHPTAAEEFVTMKEYTN